MKKLEAIWQLEGMFTNTSSMHIGDGGARPNPMLDEEGKSRGEVQTAAKASGGRARIPGTALKGVLRSNAIAPNLLFGTEEKGSTGGTVVFLDAFSEEPVKWDKHILGRTKIDPITGAAQDSFLFHLEQIPPGAKFKTRVRGRTFEGENWREQVEQIRDAFMGFNNGILRLGAGESNGWGSGTWKPTAVRVLENAAIKDWLKKSDPKPIDLLFDEIRPAEWKVDSSTEQRDSRLTIVLKFENHHFLVNDPHLTGKKIDQKHSHAARRKNVKLLLPAESFRGAFAGQAARISRTMGRSAERQQVVRDAAGELPRKLDTFTKLFGGAGWQSVVGIEDFVQTSEVENKITQEFVALDRFTGGGSEERKFDAEGGWSPHLRGSIRIDVERLKKLGDDVRPALGLLALTLRDLAESDISFGWGSSKGYGWATADTGGLSPTKWVEALLKGLSEGDVKSWIIDWEREAMLNA